MMKFLLAFYAAFAFLAVHAQPPNADALEPVEWKISSAEKNGVWEEVFHATIEHGWSVYSQQNYGDMGPWPTSDSVDSLVGVTALGKASEPGEKVLDGMDEVFGMNVK